VIALRPGAAIGSLRVADACGAPHRGLDARLVERLGLLTADPMVNNLVEAELLTADPMVNSRRFAWRDEWTPIR
jgi:hypothetical protein